MERIGVTATALLFGATSAYAGGIDRSGQSIAVIFEEENHLEFSLGYTDPSISGTGVGIAAAGLPAGTSYDGVADEFFTPQVGLKYDLDETLSLGVIVDEPFGADILFPGDPQTSELAGTEAIADSTAVTGLVRYKFSDRVSAHGGLRVQRASGNITLDGFAYGGPPIPPFNGVSGYNVDLDDNVALGYVVGAAYEIPDIALRVSLTYNSEIEHDFDTVETLGGGVIGTQETEVTLPQSVNLEFQTGVAPETLVFGGIRWVDWSEFRVDPETFVSLTGDGLVSIEDTFTYTVGIGRQFTENFGGSASIIYEPEGDDLVSPLAPTNGAIALALGGAYTLGDVELSGGIRYTWLGDAEPETGTPDVARASFDDNTATSVGFKIAYKF